MVKRECVAEDYQDALKKGPNIALVMVPCKDETERAELLEKAKSIRGEVGLAPSLKNIYH